MRVGGCRAGEDTIPITIHVAPPPWDHAQMGAFIEEVVLSEIERASREKPECEVCGAGHCSSHPDVCMGFLPHVAAACCGHGRIEKAYVAVRIDDDTKLTMKGEKAIAYMRTWAPTVGITVTADGRPRPGDADV